ncbi:MULTISPECIES: collagen-like protein [unclassified Bradyrhizobium]|uniref:collagen-like protein n=1 Tax=unclassified Bradyrhizobium TaxID=2631580 RepID=UPI0003F87E9D|nr:MULTISPECIES: collagen-like protein [unclassified Bradyrhizobium]QIG93794.1 collagen-like protein [Bradyrhizobium sp. 6(2017)]
MNDFSITQTLDVTGEVEIIQDDVAIIISPDQGPPGARGNSVLSGTSDPTSSLGVDGDFYYNEETHQFYGPKEGGIWPAPVLLTGPQGPQGAQGIQGPVGPEGPVGPTGAASTVPGPPGPQGVQGNTGPQGVIGNTGPQGAQGVQGPQGNPGVDGNTVLYGTVAPTAGIGVNGNFYINTATNFIYGPKAGGAWPSGTSLVGPQGPQGVQGVPGAGSPGTATPIMASVGAVGVSGNFSREDHVHPSDTSRVIKAGDRMTGALRVGSVRPAPAYPASVGSYSMSIDASLGFNVFVSADGSQWLAQSAGYGVAIIDDPPTGNLNFFASPASVAAGGLMTLNTTATLTQQGQWQPKSIAMTGDNGFGAITLYRTGGVTYGSLGVDASGYNINLSNGTIPINICFSGTVRAVFQNTGGLTINQPSATNVTAFNVTGATASYAADFRASGPGFAGVVGWANGTSLYGMSGENLSGTTYSFYGNTGAFLAAGAWQTSDARVKSVTRQTDPAAALAIVNALPVNEFTPANPAAREMFFGRGDVANETLYGWTAQDVELLVPIAVRDIGIPAVDRVMRAALKHIDIPELDSKEAEALGEEEMSIKAINDRYMLTTLWSAVQRLSTQNDELRAEIDALKAASS